MSAKYKKPMCVHDIMHLYKHNVITADKANQYLSDIGANFHLKEWVDIPVDVTDITKPSGSGILDIGVGPTTPIVVKNGRVVGGPINDANKPPARHSYMYVYLDKDDVRYIYEVIGDKLVFCRKRVNLMQ